MKTSLPRLVAVFAASALLALAGCSGDDPAPKTGGTGGGSTKEPGEKADAPKLIPGKKYSRADRKSATKEMKLLCATCHGATGLGNGPAGAGLNPKPRNWTDAKWQESVTDEHLFKIIKEGGAKHGLSPQMAANVNFRDRPAVLWALVDLVRKFKAKK
jgi:hypothetical protein